LVVPLDRFPQVARNRPDGVGDVVVGAPAALLGELFAAERVAELLPGRKAEVASVVQAVFRLVDRGSEFVRPESVVSGGTDQLERPLLASPSGCRLPGPGSKRRSLTTELQA
jgi:hypothetical protein